MTNTTSYEVIEVAEYYLAGRMVRMEHVLASGLTEAKARKVARVHGGTVRAAK